jgi:hypothetical protein
MSTHGVAENTQPGRQDGKARADHRREFVDDIAAHTIMCCPGRLRRIKIETGALPQSVVAAVGHPGAARAGVGRHDDQPQLRGHALRAGHDHEILMRTGQARQEIDAGYGALARGRRHENTKTHRRAGRLAVMAEDQLLAAEGCRPG